MPHPAIESFQLKTKAILEHVKAEFAKLQTGRANASLIEHISVEAYGQKMELKSVASISVQDARSLVVQPWDKSVLSDVERAITQADIGVNPVNDGIVIRLNFPPMTEERRKQLVKVVKQLTEQEKIKVRQLRQEINDELKALPDEDDRERAQKELQNMVDESNSHIDAAAKQKELEVMSV